MALERQRVSGLTDQLQALSPLAVLDRGYAIVTQAANREVVRSASQVTAGDALEVRVSEGSFKVEVTKSKQ
jgi:exodeoxyribonuclease VII large subunit